jgi:hypothetical protein
MGGIHIGNVYLRCRVPIFKARFAVFVLFDDHLGAMSKKFVSGFMSWNEALDFCQVIFRLDPKYRFQTVSCRALFDRDTPVPSRPLK